MMKKLVLLFIAIMTATSLYAADTSPGEELHSKMYNLLYEIELTAGLDHRASTNMQNLTKEDIQNIYGNITNPEQYIESIKKTLLLIQQTGTTAAAQVPFTTASGTTANYPSPNNMSYIIASGLGLVNSTNERCEESKLEYYVAALDGARETLFYADRACSIAGCDPTGIGCAAVCGATEVVNAAFHIAEIPIIACKNINDNIDSAEIEAAYDNSLSAANDSSAILDNQAHMLSN